MEALSFILEEVYYGKEKIERISEMRIQEIKGQAWHQGHTQEGI